MGSVEIRKVKWSVHCRRSVFFCVGPQAVTRSAKSGTNSTKRATRNDE
jgi:hypothetical protein